MVEGIDNCLVKFSQCCAPLPGDEIIGFITRGHGVSIHKRDCNNVPKNIADASEPERWIPVYWTSKQEKNFLATLQILSIDRDGLLVDVSSVMLNMRVPLNSLNARRTKDGNCIMIATVNTEGVEHLNSIIAHLEKVRGVYHVERISQ